jgi:endonuclease YncB( thermonuclease family)
MYLLRLRDIEAPEIDEPFGIEARDRLASRVVGQKLLIRAEKGRGCVIAVRAQTAEGKDLAEELVSAGLARVRSGAPEVLRLLEERARLEKKGLWRGTQSVLPRKF